jgi:hypothetical protein
MLRLFRNNEGWNLAQARRKERLRTLARIKVFIAHFADHLRLRGRSKKAVDYLLHLVDGKLRPC